MTPLQIAFIIVTPIIVILVVAAILYKPLMKRYNKKHFKKAYYKKIYKTTLYGDYFLINDFLFFHEDNKTTQFDHLMLGEKFIYVIKDYYFPGSLKGSGDDQSLVLLKDDKKQSKHYVENPLIESQTIVKRLSMITNIDKSMFIGISLVNDECNIDVNLTNTEYYVIQASKFQKLVKEIESRPIPDINQEELQQVVKDLDKLNKKGKRHVKKNI